MKPEDEDKPGRLPTVSGPNLGPANLSTQPEVEGYEILRVLGEGGMGVVYLAWQKHPIERQVALKVIKAGMDTKQVIARFEAERQALAMLDHPNIAHVYDAGTTVTGHPYFVMEYVKGRALTDYCDKYGLDIEERLKLFAQVCDAIHHAHQKSIIHRDIKPSNILVTLDGQKAIPKVIDFGVAKATSQPLTERTLSTEQGQLLGTPEYMSPEQAELMTQNIDTRTDIYSLGVVLYEVLTGALPFDPKSLREGGIEHIRKVIGNEEPVTPSIRLTSLGKNAEVVAERRKTKVRSLARRLQSELEWIPLKAIRKDRARRYRSVAEFSDDIENYLCGAPLIAGPESTFYRMHKFIRRHRFSCAALGLTLFIGMVIGVVAGVNVYKMAMDMARQKREAFRNVINSKPFGMVRNYTSWMNVTDYKKELEKQSENKHYPYEIYGRSYKGEKQYRVCFRPFPSFDFRSCHGLQQQSFEEWDKWYSSIQRYERIFTNIFYDEEGVKRYQATWIRFIHKSPKVNTHRGAKFIISKENLQIPDDMQACSTNLRIIQEAIDEYKKDKGKLPDWLSDLVPDYISQEILLCPNDLKQRAKYSPDAKLPCSYSWEMSPLPNTWDPTRKTSYYDWKMEQAKTVGNVVPIIRCHHHGTNEVLNLSLSGQIYRSPLDWERMFKVDYRFIDDDRTQRQK